MNIQEFSNTFDTLLNSYNNQAAFGEGSSRADIALDEYEKSVLLTHAQDIVVKQYFDRTLNPQGQGFDDSVRRQIDFSALISNKSIKVKIPVISQEVICPAITSLEEGNEISETKKQVILTFTNCVDKVITLTPIEGKLYTDVPQKDTEDNPQIVENLVKKESIDSTTINYSFKLLTGGINYNQLIEALNNAFEGNILVQINDEVLGTEQIVGGYLNPATIRLNAIGDTETYDDRGVFVNLPSNLLFTLNEKVVDVEGKNYVVVPINYREYDRQMSRAYTQPLKKQAWRLFNDGNADLLKAELIPVKGTIIDSYKVRYIRRPRPIVLVDLTVDNLDIEGVSTPTECELNPIIHLDILNKAVELALTTRGAVKPSSSSKQQ